MIPGIDPMSVDQSSAFGDSHCSSPCDDVRDELEWSAFRYVADEMSADEAAAFEGLLAENALAREAVARTVQITHALVSLPEKSTRRATTVGGGASLRRSTRWASAATILLITAFGAVLAIGLRFSNVTTVRSPDSKRFAGGSSAQPESVKGRDLVISAWLDFKTEDVLPEEKLIVGTDLTEAAPLAASVEAASTEDDGKFDWIVAAIDPEMLRSENLENLRKGEQ